MLNGLIANVLGDQRWYKDDKYHREDDLPAVIRTDGTKLWRINGKAHRENGPADIFASGIIRWRLNSEEYEFDDWCDLLNKSSKEKAFLMLKYL